MSSNTAQSGHHASDVKTYVRTVGVAARQAARAIATASSDIKNAALNAIAEEILANQADIMTANEKDMAAGRQNNLTSALLDRLKLTPDRIQAMANGCTQIGQLPDPVGEMTPFVERPSGIKIAKMRVPLGVIGIIYESRPNVTIDAAALCLKSGNAVILRGGSEAINSNLAIAKCIYAGLDTAGLPRNAIQVINTTDRAAVGALITMSEHVDIIIPRGGKSLIQRISAEATVPVIKHLEGLCHVYIDEHADREKAMRVAYNAKARRYGICGAMETLLVSEKQAPSILPDLIQQYQDKGIEVRGCDKTKTLVANISDATESDWQTEYLDAILSIRIVDGIDAAIDHISQYSSQHTDAIISEDETNQQRFLREVDSSSVMINASTQFADGFEYGLGAEIGISTDKLHVRGPVGLEGLTSQKYVVTGDGTIRQ